MNTTLREQRTVPGTVAGLTGRRLEVTILTPGIGSSGVYSPEVIAQAARDKAFGKGCHMYMNHDGDGTEAAVHGGVRSVKNLAAVLDEDARWTGAALVATARTIDQWSGTLRDAADAIGVSISAQAQFSRGADGRPVVERIVPDPRNSVDFVTIPGRGGSYTVLESAIRRIGSGDFTPTPEPTGPVVFNEAWLAPVLEGIPHETLAADTSWRREACQRFYGKALNDLTGQLMVGTVTTQEADRRRSILRSVFSIDA